MPITTYLNKSRIMLALVLSTVLGTAQANEPPVYKLTLAETWGANTPILGDAPKNMAKLAAEMSNGRIQIRIDSANKHKAPLGVFDMVKSGQYDLGFFFFLTV
ncbi:ABC transporter substrate-binding protein, partial [Vibrio cholerae]|nr:ABC transporter substrate-binding protein [Vibrio cholerae]